MANIRVLPIHLVNKIAAGEVIERPASIVKELVENALDAGAGRIDVTVEDGGRRLIVVSDNGSGMDAEDLALAFAPHATSKIKAEDDLFAIATMGFRGEALASIAAISHAHVRTRRHRLATGAAEPAAPADSEPELSGYEIEASGENISEARPCAAAGGTTVTIRDLFFNTPARRKFMKAANTELGHITEQMTRLALPHPHVAFSLTHNGRSVQKLPACGTTLQRVIDIFGQELGQAMLPIRARSGRIGVAGLTGRPDAARATAGWQYFFLNGRYIRDRLLSHALKESYRGVIEPSRWPAAMVFLQIDPAEVDVNVHPTKIEVRFRDGQAVHAELLAALRETLNRANLASAAQFDRSAPVSLASASVGAGAMPASALTGEPASPTGFAVPSGTSPTSAQDGSRVHPEDSAPGTPAEEQRRVSLRQAMADFFRSAPSPQPRLQFPERAVDRHVESLPAAAASSPPAVADRADDAELSRAQDAPATRSPYRRATAGDAGAVDSAAGSDTLPIGVLQVHNSYIVAGTEDGLVIIDQHALHERILYNDLKRRLADGCLEGQRLLIPETLAVSAAQAVALEENTELLERLGLEIVSFGPGTVAVQRFPLLLSRRGVKMDEFIRELLDSLAEGRSSGVVPGGSGSEKLLESLLETMACKAAVKAGDPLSAEEMQALLARSQEVEKSSSCPHGRPTTLKLSLKDLQKQFKRT